MKHIADRFVGSQWPMQVLRIGFPVSQICGLENSQPFQPECNMLNLIMMNCFHDCGSLGITCRLKIFLEFQRVIEVTPFEGEGNASQVI